MPEAGQITYSLRELTALMIRDRGIRSGNWMIWTKFNFTATNIATQGGGPAGPGVVAYLAEAGIQKADAPGPLSVDAAEVWKDTKKEAVGKKKSP